MTSSAIRRFLQISLAAVLLLDSISPAVAWAMPADRPVGSITPEGNRSIKQLPLSKQPAMATAGPTIEIGATGFEPRVITVTVGTEVAWINIDSQPHSVAIELPAEESSTVFLPVITKPGPAAPSPAVDQPARPLTSSAVLASLLWQSSALAPGNSAAYAFNESGRFAYYDPLNLQLTGEVVILPPNQPPQVLIDAPAEGQVEPTGPITVQGTVVDADGQVVSLTVNGQPAGLNNGAFQTSVNLDGGSQTLVVAAIDDRGAVSTAQRIIAVDGEGPHLSVAAPKDRQAVYTNQPAVAVTFDDYLSQVDLDSFQAEISGGAGFLLDIGGDLSLSNSGASGNVGAALSSGRSYTLTVSLADNLGNVSSVASRFYVPADPSSVNPPAETDGDGWISGQVFDSGSCRLDITDCLGLAGASVTLTRVYSEALGHARSTRQAEVLDNWRSAGSVIAPVYSLLATAAYTTPISGTIVTGSDGFFAFPVTETGHYWLRVEKEGYTYGQREAAIVRQRTTATNSIYLTPIDPAMTLCSAAGCSHENSDFTLQIDIPPGAIPDGQSLQVTATNFKHVEFLPSGSLPPGTWETYAFNLGGDSEFTFTPGITATVRVSNTRGFAPGTQIPLGYWNQALQQWEHAGTGVVDAAGKWVEAGVSHFSNYDHNFPIEPFYPSADITVNGDGGNRDGSNGDGNGADPDPPLADMGGNPGDDEESPCTPGQSGCFVHYKSGVIHEWLTTPAVKVMGQEEALVLGYSSDRVQPSEVIDLSVSTSANGTIELLGHIGFTLYIEGQNTDHFTFDADLNQAGEIGRFRYFWDGRDAQGQKLPPGIYQYLVELDIPYRSEYCLPLAGIFGNPPDCTSGRTGVFADVFEQIEIKGFVAVDEAADSPFGAGWVLNDQQRLIEDEAGQVLIVDGQRTDKFYLRNKDLLQMPEESPAAYPAPASSHDGLSAIRPVVGNLTGSSPGGPAPAASQQPGAGPSPAVDSSIPEPIWPTGGPHYSEKATPQADSQTLVTEVCGQILSDVTWSLANSPYLVTCDVAVNAGYTLTIEPGVAVQFNQHLSLFVAGAVLAEGTEALPITFKPAGGVDLWRHIGFFSGSQASLSHIIVSGGGYSGTGDPAGARGALFSSWADVTVSNSIFRENGHTAAVWLYSGSPVISNTQFLTNTNSWDQLGGGMAVLTNALVKNNTFRGNQANGGAGIFVYQGAPHIDGNLIIGNVAPKYFSGLGGLGGGIYVRSGSPLITNNVFRDNLTLEDPIIGGAQGAGLYNKNGRPVVYNNQFIANRSGFGGGLASQGFAVVEHNLFWENTAGLGGGLYLGYDLDLQKMATPQIYSNLIVSNTAKFHNGGGIYVNWTRKQPFIDYNLLWNNDSDYHSNGIGVGAHDVNADPLFVDSTSLDFRLQAGSPAVDAGFLPSASTQDLDGRFRPLGPAPDIGLYEAPGLGLRLHSSADSVAPGGMITYTLTIANESGNPAPSMAVSLTLPSELAFIGLASPHFTCSHDGQSKGGELNCSGSLADGQQTAVTIVAKADPDPLAPALLLAVGALWSGGQMVNRTPHESWLSWCLARLNEVDFGGDIQGAINASASPADTVSVSGRCLAPQGIVITKTLTLQGGWNRAFTTRDPEIHLTTLDAQYESPVITVRDLVSPTIEGVIISHGAGSNGGGFFVDNDPLVVAGPTIRDNVIFSNAALYGGGISAGRATIQDNVIEDNAAAFDGGGLAVVRGAVYRNFIAANQAEDRGGGLHLEGPAMIDTNIFVDNRAGTGGGLYLLAPPGTPAATIQSNVFYQNQASLIGGGLYFQLAGAHFVRNNAIIGNSGSGLFSSQTPPDFDYNNVWGNTSLDYWGMDPGEHDISMDPRFADPASNDFHLLLSSPNIDAGDAAFGGSPDIDGDSRPLGLGPDIGVDEVKAGFSPAVKLNKSDTSRLLFDLAGGLYQRLYPDGTEVHFNADGSHAYTLAPDGKKTVYSYNGDGSLAAVAIAPPSETSSRWIWTFAYQNGRLASITDPAGRQTTFIIDGNNHLVSSTTPDGATRHFAYDSGRLLTQEQDQNGQVSDYFYDNYGRISKLLDPAREVFDPQTGQITVSRPETIIEPSDTTLPMINDSPAGSPSDPAPAVPKSDQVVESVTFPEGTLSGQTDRFGFWLMVTDALSQTETTIRNPAGWPSYQQSADGDCSAFTYDEAGNVLTEVRMAAAVCAGNTPDPGEVITRSFTYEQRFNQVKTVTDFNGNTTTYTYDYELDMGQAGKLVKIDYPAVLNPNGVMESPVVFYTYNALGLLETETDARGAVTRYVYTTGAAEEAAGGANPLFAPGVTPTPGLLTKVIYDDGGLAISRVNRQFNAAGFPQISVGLGGKQATHIVYDESNRIISQTDAVGVETTFEYDSRGNLLRQVVDPGGRDIRTDYEYDPEDRVIRTVTGDGRLLVGSRTLYDLNGRPALREDGRGSQTFYRYDEANQLKNVVDPAGYVVSYTYTLDGRLATFTDVAGYVTAYEYDPFDRRTREIQDVNGLALIKSTSYDANGNVVRTTDAAGLTSCSEYDALNRKTLEIKDCEGLDLLGSYGYDLNGNIVTQRNPRGIVTRYEYDGLNRETGRILDDGGLNLKVSISYDAAGNVIKFTDERGILYSSTFDDLNRRTARCQDTAGLNLCTSYAYDALGNLASTTDPNGVTTVKEFNGFGLEVKVVEDAGGVEATTRNSYDNALNLIRIEDANGNKTDYRYSARNEQVQETYADGASASFVLDSRGYVQSRINQDGTTISHQFDGAGRLVRRDFSTGGGQTFSYDGVGRRTEAAETANGHDSRINYAYDALGYIISDTQSLDGTSWTTLYAYDYTAGVYTQTYPSGAQRIQTIDALDRVAAIGDGAGQLLAEFSYHDLSGYQTWSYPNGLTNRLDFDSLGRTARISSAVADYRYGYDKAGYRLYQQRAHLPGMPADVYEYDRLYRPVQVWYGADAIDPAAITTQAALEVYSHDFLANRLAVDRDGQIETYEPNNGRQLTDPMNRYEQAAGQALTYDLQGNTLIQGAAAFSYDLLNRQRSASKLGTTAEYIYDALGRRIAKTVNGSVTTFIYDLGNQVLEERDGSNALLARYTYNQGIDKPLLMERGDQSYYYHRDAQGSITEMTNAGGQLVEAYTYDIFGQPRFVDGDGKVLSASAISNPYLYTARRFDPESGSYTFRARSYSPDTGRFLQMDPIGYADGMNLYASYFVINGRDPSGMLSTTATSYNLFSFSTFRGRVGWGGGISLDLERDAKTCCDANGRRILLGERYYGVKVSWEGGIGVDRDVRFAGRDFGISLVGPHIEGEMTLRASNSHCGGPIDSVEGCKNDNLNLGAKGGIEFASVTYGADAFVQGQISVCLKYSPGRLTLTVKGCFNSTLKLWVERNNVKQVIYDDSVELGCPLNWHLPIPV